MNMLIYHGPCTTSVITAANLPSVFANTNHCGLFFSLIFFLFFFSPKTQSARDQYCLSVLSPPTQPHPTEMPRVPSVCREKMVGWQPCPTWPTGSPGRRTGWNSPVRLSTRAHTSLRRRSKKSASTVSELWDLFFFTKHIFILVLERSMGVRLWKTRNAKKKKRHDRSLHQIIDTEWVTIHSAGGLSFCADFQFEDIPWLWYWLQLLFRVSR